MRSKAISKASYSGISNDSIWISSWVRAEAENRWKRFVISSRISPLNLSQNSKLRDELQELQPFTFLSETSYRELKSRWGQVFRADMGADEPSMIS